MHVWKEIPWPSSNPDFGLNAVNVNCMVRYWRPATDMELELDLKKASTFYKAVALVLISWCLAALFLMLTEEILNILVE
jgi:uncharacterized membrane protein YidH (DUF202 family)